jgi:hypothetical protein
MNSTIVLADLRLAEPADLVSGWTPGLERTVQRVALARARQAVQFERGAALVSYTFAVSRGHSSLAAAEDYLVQLPRQVALAFGNFSASRGLGAQEVRLVGCAATFSAAPATGLRTLVTFTVTGALPPS